MRRISIQNGTSCICTKNKVVINGEEVKIPKGMRTNSQTIINGRVFIGGYEYIPKKKCFKKTLRALWELLW